MSHWVLKLIFFFQVRTFRTWELVSLLLVYNNYFYYNNYYYFIFLILAEWLNKQHFFPQAESNEKLKWNKWTFCIFFAFVKHVQSQSIWLNYVFVTETNTHLHNHTCKHAWYGEVDSIHVQRVEAEQPEFKERTKKLYVI